MHHSTLGGGPLSFRDTYKWFSDGHPYLKTDLLRQGMNQDCYAAEIQIGAFPWLERRKG